MPRDCQNQVFVYFARCRMGGRSYVKVGKARDPDQRIKGFQTGCPASITIDYRIPCESDREAYEVESEAHAAFSPYRKSGEWFEINAGFVEALQEFLWLQQVRNDFIEAYLDEKAKELA